MKNVYNMRLDVVGEIGKNFTAQSFFETIATRDEKETVELYINSYGGSLVDALAVYDRLKNTPDGKKTKAIGYISGFAGSAATVIACAMDKVYMGSNSFYFIHLPFFEGGGGRKDDLDKMAASLVDIYFKKTGINKGTLKAMLKKETLMSAQEAYKMGFVDGIVKEQKAVAFMDAPDKIKALINHKKSSMNLKNILNQIGDMLVDRVKNLEASLADGTIIYVDTDGDTIMEGQAVYVGENKDAAPDGEHVLADGRIVVTKDGVITEIKEAQAEYDKEDMEQLANKVLDMATMLNQVKTELAELKAKNAEVVKANGEQAETIKALENKLGLVKNQVRNQPAKQEQAPTATANKGEQGGLAKMLQDSLRKQKMINN